MNQTEMPPEEFEDRRKKLCKMIDADAKILIGGADGAQGNEVFRQYNEFYYFCGVEVPHAYLLIDSKTSRTSLFLPADAQLENTWPDEKLCAENADLVCSQTGVDECLGLAALGARLEKASALYLPFRQGELRSASPDSLQRWYANVLADPWDGRAHRSAHLVGRIRERLPGLKLSNLSPLIDELRLIKSSREIDFMRRAGELTALGVVEAMRSTRQGVTEYQLDAILRYHYLAGGAADRGYFSIIASGKNIMNGHYSANRSALSDGDLILCDNAPDYGYYTSDIGRMWPVSGTYTPEQRALYGYVVECEKILLQIVRAGRTVAEIKEELKERMKEVDANWNFVKPEYREIASTLHSEISHCVGMAVHDGSKHFSRPLEPGMVFSLDPSLRDMNQQIYIRVEDTVVVTEDGVENLTAGVPLDLDAVEQIMGEDGLLQAFSPG